MVSNPKSLFESVDAFIFTPQSRSANTFMGEVSHDSVNASMGDPVFNIVNASKNFSQLCGANTCKTASSRMSPLKHPHPSRRRPLEGDSGSREPRGVLNCLAQPWSQQHGPLRPGWRRKRTRGLRLGCSPVARWRAGAMWRCCEWLLSSWEIRVCWHGCWHS